MPLAGIDRIVIDPLRCAEAYPAIGTACKHYVSSIASGGPHAGQHVNVVVRRTARAINRQEQLSAKPARIDCAAENDATAHVDWGNLIKSRRLVPDLRIARALAIKRRATEPATDKKVAVGGHIERSIYRPVRDIDRRLPGHPAVGGTLEFHAAAATVNTVVCLVLEAVSRAVGLIDGEPFLVAAATASFAREQRPGLATV